MIHTFDANSNRDSAFIHWLKHEAKINFSSIERIPGDASARQYFRIHADDTTYMLMDAPENDESLDTFLSVTDLFQTNGVRVPKILQQDKSQGFLLLSDFGDNTLHRILNKQNSDTIYRLSIDSLLQIQKCNSKDNLPVFEKTFMQKEMNLFTEWFLAKQLELNFSPTEQATLDLAIATIITNVEQQPYTCVHRDYHSRNLLLVDNQTIGIIDHQDAVHGPITYDLVSLLRDCYMKWPQQQVSALARYYVEQAALDCDFEQFMVWFDWTGMQRHMKAIGIFARLNKLHRKPGYLRDIPRTINYLIDASSQYPELSDFNSLLTSKIVPAIARSFIGVSV